MEKITYKKTIVEETEHELEIDPLNCFFKSGNDYIGRLEVEIEKYKTRYVTISITRSSSLRRGVSISFYKDVSAYMNTIPFKMFIEDHYSSFRQISKEDFLEVLNDKITSNSAGLIQYLNRHKI